MDTNKKRPANQPVELQQLLTAVFNDAVTANGNMAMEQINFMLNNCFTKNGDEYVPNTVTIALNRDVITPGVAPDNEPAFQTTTTKFNVPLLTLVPLNSLAVSNINIELDLDFTTVTNQSTEAGTNFTSILVKTEKSDSADDTEAPLNRLKVSATTTQLPIPKGINMMIEAFSQSIQPITVDKNNNPT